ncbi:MAG: aspartate aminotransferase family protein, partial [Bdellovibrionales bacterium]|nr:aspartate aminotransferase family protein [Bdellovibrionales bacterium]
MALTDAPLLNTYKRSPIVFKRGRGVFLYDSNGKEYIDCLAGLAVVSLGHANERLAEVICNQAATLVHVSNLFWTEPMAKLARVLVQHSGEGYRVFFGNSGAEATECALKIARKRGAGARSKVVAAERSFHGRTFASLAATGQPAKWKGFEPLPEGFVHCPFNQLAAWDAAIDDRTAAVLVEPIQGEGGVHPATDEFLSGLRKLCDERGALLVFDEIQSGMGRSGSWWAWQQYDVRPDVFLSAKALANGLPIGACIVDERVAEVFQPGDHGSTFGGGPVVCAAALEAIAIIESERLCEHAKEKGALLAEMLSGVSGVVEVRGKGMMVAAELESGLQSARVAEAALEQGLVVNNVTPSAIRFTPPLVITEEEM